MASINIGKNNYKDDKSFVSDYVDYVIDKKLEDYDEHMSDTSNPHQVTKAQVGLSNVDNTSDLNKPISNATQVAIDGILENTSIIADENGGFHAGTSSAFISDGTGGAIGYGATTAHGGSAGRAAYSTTGFAGGDQSSTGKGGAAGEYANSSDGFAGGNSAKADDGGAVGSGAKAGDGFAGGSGAKAVASNGSGIDAIQLGTGTNSAEGTLQVYSYQLLDEEGKIPDARLNDATSDGGLYGRKDGAWERVTKDAIGLSNVDNTSDANKPISAETQAALDAITENTSNIQNSSGGFSAGMTSQAKGGGAVGSGSYANSGFAGGVTAYAGFGGAVGAYAQVTGGGAVGQNAVTSDGFAGGKNAIAGEDYSNGIDAIQLGTGTNSTPKTMQVYGYQLLDANGKIPDARLNDAPSDGTLYGRKNGGWAAVTAGLETVDIDDIDDIKTEGLYRLNNYFEEELPSGQTADQKYVELLVVSDYVYVSDPSVRQTRYKSDGTVITREFNYMDNGGTWYDWQEVGHTHTNKSILDATEVAYTESDQARISTLENDLDTFYTDLNDLQNTALSDAPSDGNTYARKDGAWTNLTRQIGKQLINFVPLEYDGSDVTDLDNLPSGITIVDYADGPGYGGYMVMTSLEGSGYGYQIKISIEGLSYRYNNGTWGAWIKIG